MGGAPRPFHSLKPSAQAGILAASAPFQKFAAARLGFAAGTRATPTSAAEYIRRTCNVHSRADLNTNPAAHEKWQALRTEYDAWRGAIPSPR